jgi:ankyrin repeat protein
MQLLLAKDGIDLESKATVGFIEGVTPLWLAAGYGHEAVMRLLLQKGADVDSKDKRNDRTPLSLAVEKGQEAVVKLLVEKGADVDSKDKKE